MKHIFFICVVLANYASAQVSLNFVLVDKNRQITQKAKDAIYLIVVKKYNDTCFERLEYNFLGPRIRSIFYKDAGITIKHGTMIEYDESGTSISYGSNANNQKVGKWIDKKLKKEFEFENGVQVSENPIKMAEVKPAANDTIAGEVESSFAGGLTEYMRFLNRNFRYPERAQKMAKQGIVVMQYVVEADGSVNNPEIASSVEFSLDEEALRLASIMPKWIPAKKDGIAVRSYKKQPVIFKLER